MKNKIVGIFVCTLLFSGIFYSVANAQTNLITNINRSLIKNYEDVNDFSFDSEVRLLMKFFHIPGLTVGVIKNNSTVWSKSYGYSDIYNHKKASTDTIYQVASISKTFVSVALLQLYEQGLFDLDDNVSEYLPFDLKNPKFPDVNITFRMLLSHHSSFCCTHVESILQPLEPSFEPTVRNALTWYLINWIHLKDVLSGFYPEEKYPWIKEVMVPGGSLYHAEHWGDFPPGEGYYYSNTAYILLGYLLERLSNQSCEDYCRDHLFIPLSMHNTSFYYDDLNPDKCAVPYFWFHRIYIPIPNFDYYCKSPAQGLKTNFEDLSHWLIAHMNGGIYNGVRILNESTIEEMHTVQYPHIEPGMAGLGWNKFGFLDGIFQGYNGNNLGYISGIHFYSPNGSSDKYGIIYFWNEELWGCSPIGFLPQYKDEVLRDIVKIRLLNWALEF